MDTPDYVWVEGDSILRQYFIMSVATIYPDESDSTGASRLVECQVTLGDSTTVAGTLGSRLELALRLNGNSDGQYAVGDACKGTISYILCTEGKDDKVNFKKDVYTLNAGSVNLSNKTGDTATVALSLDLTGERKVLVVNEYGDSSYVTPTIKLTGDLVARK